MRRGIQIRAGGQTRAAMVTAGVLLLAACGSTVQPGTAGLAGSAGAGLGPGAPGATDGLGVPTGTQPGESAGIGQPGAAPPGVAGAGPGSAGTVSGATSSVGGGSGSAGQGGTAGPAAGGGSGPVSGRGFTAKEILIGVATQLDSSSYSSSLGTPMDFGNAKAQMNAMADEINKQGGILGRKIRLVFHDDNAATSSADPNTGAQAACEAWTQDNEVFAVLNNVALINNEVLYSCLAKNRTPLIFSDATPHSDALFDKYAPYLYGPATITVDRMIPIWLDRLMANKYFDAWDTALGGPSKTAKTKVGIFYYESKSDYVQLGKVLQRELTKRGYPPVVASGSGRQDSASSDMAQIALKFKQEDVTHVIAYGIGSFGTAAQNQNYYPRYGTSTYEVPSLLQTTQPSTQLRGALGIGWAPQIDVDAARDPGDVSPAQAQCRKLMQQAGQDTSNRLSFYAASIFCDIFRLLQQSTARGGQLTEQAVQQGVASLGDSFQSAITFGSRFGPGRYDGTSAVRDLAYDQGCSCFKYTSKTNHPA